MEKIYYCSVSGEPLPGSRVEALKMLGVPENMWTAVQHSKSKKIKGIYFGSQGSGKLVLASNVYDEGMTDVSEALDKQEKTEKSGYQPTQ
jgi:hypothetical protein